MDVIKVEQLSREFKEGGSSFRALAGVTLSIAAGAFTALCGPSGSGKTTLLNLMGCLDRPTGGRVWVEDEETSRLPQDRLARIRLTKIGFIFQDYNLIPTFSASENIEYVLWLQGVSAAERRRRAAEVATRFGLGALLSRRPAQLSRGQQQRVAVARAVVHKPRIVLGDEMTANLDHKTGRSLMEFLKELNQKDGITFVYATHDPAMIEYSESVIRMQDGEVLEYSAAS